MLKQMRSVVEAQTKYRIVFCLFCLTVLDIRAAETGLQKGFSPPVRKLSDFTGPKTRALPLYDPNRMVEFRLEFAGEDSDWFAQLYDTYNTSYLVPGVLRVDSQRFKNVGVRFKGASSFTLTPDTRKKSFDLNLAWLDQKQRLYGYKKLNLNNGFLDPSMVREVVFLEMCRRYVPAAQANPARLMINDEVWGAYASVQQINRDFFEEWFPNGKGNLWRGVRGSVRGSQKPFVWLGPELEDYLPYYDLRSERSEDAWEDLIRVTYQLEHLEEEELESQLDKQFGIDNALWLIALENALMDTDGFLRKGYDYFIFQEPEQGRFFLIQHDGNEVFGAGVEGQWGEGVGLDLDPFFQVDNPLFPVVSRLLSTSSLKERYLAHLKTVIEECLDWSRVEPRIRQLQALMGETMNESVTELYPVTAFHSNIDEDWKPTPEVSVPGLKNFFEKRREFLLNHPLVSMPSPKIESVQLLNSADEVSHTAGQPIVVRSLIGDSVPVSEVFLFYSLSKTGAFQRVRMHDDGQHLDSLFAGAIPPQLAGTGIRYYIEARADGDVPSAVFAPARAEHEFYFCQVQADWASSSSVVINEVVSRNANGISDGEREREDWIEVLNIGAEQVDISGWYLSDDVQQPRKWKFPGPTVLSPGDRLLVWADKDEGTDHSYHANFKLSQKGEFLRLSSSDETGNRIHDQVSIPPLRKDEAYGRWPDGVGGFRLLNPSPRKENR